MNWAQNSGGLGTLNPKPPEAPQCPASVKDSRTPEKVSCSLRETQGHMGEYQNHVQKLLNGTPSSLPIIHLYP